MTSAPRHPEVFYLKQLREREKTKQPIAHIWKDFFEIPMNAC